MGSTLTSEGDRTTLVSSSKLLPGLKEDLLSFFLRKARLLLSSAVNVFRRLSPNNSRMIVNCFSWGEKIG